MSAYRGQTDISDSLRQEVQVSLQRIFDTPSLAKTKAVVSAELKRLSKIAKKNVTQDVLIKVFREDAGQNNLPPLTEKWLRRIRLKPTRSLSGIQTVAVLTKPFPCPGQCIFCPNDIRMPKSYIASEPGAQRAQRNNFDPYLQTYNRLRALRNMGHQPSKIELIVLGGTWSFYPESYQVWFIHECFRAMNDFGEGLDDRPVTEKQIAQTVSTNHRQNNRFVNTAKLKIKGQDLKNNYNQVVSKYYLAPEIEIEGGLDVRRETRTWEQLEKQHQRNEKGQVRCVGLTLETRPDNISPQEVLRLRRLGATKTQIGIQSLSDQVLQLNKRGHDVAATRQAISLLRRAGFKIHVHWMPNLYGSSVEQDKQEFLKLYLDPDFKPDELKIYPCALIPSAELMAYYQRGEWQPYSTQQLHDVLAFSLVKAPPWTRFTRIVRDIPDNETVTSHLPTNLRQMVQDKLHQENCQLQDIRAREIRKQAPTLPWQTRVLGYTTSTGREIFIEIIDQTNKILGFLRLALPDNNSTLSNDLYTELKNEAIIRELHIYGQVEQFGQSGQTQHRGWGSKLVDLASQIAKENGYARLGVISAVGTRGYYRKLGFKTDRFYQHLDL